MLPLIYLFAQRSLDRSRSRGAQSISESIGGALRTEGGNASYADDFEISESHGPGEGGSALHDSTHGSIQESYPGANSYAEESFAHDSTHDDSVIHDSIIGDEIIGAVGGAGARHAGGADASGLEASMFSVADEWAEDGATSRSGKASPRSDALQQSMRSVEDDWAEDGGRSGSGSRSEREDSSFSERWVLFFSPPPLKPILSCEWCSQFDSLFVPRN